MTALDHSGRRAGQLSSPRRNNYYYGKLLDVPHLEMEQSYGRDLRHLVNRLGLGAGVLCGLGVTVREGLVVIGPGVAVDERGGEIIVSEPFGLDPWLLTDGFGGVAAELPRDTAHTVSLCLSYAECATDYSPALVTDCAPQRSCVAGTTVEAFRVEVRPGTPQVRPGGLPPEVCAALFGTDRATNTGQGDLGVVATIRVSGRPAAVAVGADGRRAIVVNLMDEAIKLQFIDVATNEIFHTIDDARLTAPFVGVSIAPDGGPAFVTHAGGVAVVDLAADPPRMDHILGDTRYGVCAAAFGGTVLFAYDPERGRVDRVTVGGSVDHSIDIGTGVVDLAVSPDSRWLYAAFSPDAPLARIDIGVDDTEIVKLPSVSTGPARTLAVRAVPGGPEARIAIPGLVRAFHDTAASEHSVAVDPIDSAFSADGGHYYLVNAPASGAAELVVFASDDYDAVIRVPVGAAPSGVAAGGLRALVTNAGDGTVTVVDLGPPDRYRMLCRLLAGACATPSADPCVHLATVELRPRGEIGAIDTCGHRPVLLSNAVLLDLILCLAERLDVCCHPAEIRIEPADLPAGRVGETYPDATVVASGGVAPYALTLDGALPPGLTANPAGPDSLAIGGVPGEAGSFGFLVRAQDSKDTSAVRGYTIKIAQATLRITSVIFLQRSETQATVTPLGSVPLVFPRGRLIAIGVVFTHEVDITTVTTVGPGSPPPPLDSVSFRVEDTAGVGVPGVILPSEDSRTVVFAPGDGGFPTGEIRVTLIGEGPHAMRATAALGGTRLDGDRPGTGLLPSGDGTEGGNFAFDFRIEEVQP